MSFRVTARTVLQLGAELISSDSVAFYELIKNAFDAGSHIVFIDVCVRMDHSAYLSHSNALRDSMAESKFALDDHRRRILADIDPAAPEVDDLIGRIEQARLFPTLSQCLEEANYIQLRDQGHGMSVQDLEEIFLTIGTPHRRRQRSRRIRAVSSDGGDSTTLRPILGEKGLGRLSAMRLGWRLDISTTTKGDKRWNRLQIDWRQFTDDSLLVEDVSISPQYGALKQDLSQSGTRIRIYALVSSWSPDKLRKIAADEFSKLTDPFVPETRYPINIRYNDQPVKIQRFDDILFKYAHASAEAEYTVGEEGPKFSGTVQYRIHNRKTTFVLDKRDLVGITEPSSPDTLASLGPFRVQFYWYNRRILSAIEEIGNQTAVRELVAAWSGGLKVYRDGFRVNPYGNPDDDWLDLDRSALASSGYKVNRRQIIGVVAISSLNNPALIDQTNREGLRDCPEKDVLKHLLKHLFISEFRNYLNTVDEELNRKIPPSFEELEERVESEERKIQQNLNTLFERYPEAKKDYGLVKPIHMAIGQIRSLMAEASNLAEKYNAGRSQLTNLAGIGLMVEIVAHELNRATSHTLRIIADADHIDMDSELASLLQTLGAQMQTLQKRLRILDPLSTAGRQHKERFDLVSWIRYILDTHTAQFTRHDVELDFKVVPESPAPSMHVLMVKGMFVQILENLISNSMYWLKVERSLDALFTPRIQITLDKTRRVLTFTDNGPGIPLARKEQAFQPFFTTKRPGEGYGLGLYVSKEIAHYNGANFMLADDETIHKRKLNTFLLELGDN